MSTLPPTDEYLKELAEAFDLAPRYGTKEDEPEGTRYITVSDTLAKRFSKELKELCNRFI